MSRSRLSAPLKIPKANFWTLIKKSVDISSPKASLNLEKFQYVPPRKLKPWPKPIESINLNAPYILRSLAATFAGLTCKLFMKIGCAKVYLLNFDHLLNNIEDMPKGGLLTVQSHASTLDDPLIWGALPLRFLVKPETNRWSMAAKELIFLNPLLNAFFEAGQVIPTVRGAGIYQPAIDASIKLLDQGQWVNIYPEAKVNQDLPLLKFKWGVGRIIQEAKGHPIVIPIYHSGMVGLLPQNAIKMPRIGKHLVFSVGKPIDIKAFLDKDQTYQDLLKSELHDKARSYVAFVLQQHLENLKTDTLKWMEENNVPTYFKPNNY